MPEQVKEESRVRAENRKRDERAQRIMDVASELIIRFGYKKTTIDDIARQARVAKGTIYLHWKTREELFMAMIRRETLSASEEVLERILQDPEGVLLHTITRHALYVALKRPLVKALLIGDTEMLSELVQRTSDNAASYYDQSLIASRHLLELLRKHNLIRVDQIIDEQLQMYSAITIGFLSMNYYLPNGLQVSIERNTEMLAETIQRTFAESRIIETSRIQEVSEQIYPIFQTVLDKIRGNFSDMFSLMPQEFLAQGGSGCKMQDKQ